MHLANSPFLYGGSVCKKLCVGNLNLICFARKSNGILVVRRTESSLGSLTGARILILRV